MAIGRCSRCRKDVSLGALVCPYCGVAKPHKFRPKVRTWLYAVGSLFALVALSTVFSGQPPTTVIPESEPEARSNVSSPQPTDSAQHPVDASSSRDYEPRRPGRPSLRSSVDVSLEILGREKANMQRVQDQIAAILGAMPATADPARAVILERQREIVRIQAEVLNDDRLQEPEIKNIVSTLATESESLSRQMGLLSAWE
jgi:DNA-directed RNA polymerase subunit RPC12/RpoP